MIRLRGAAAGVCAAPASPTAAVSAHNNNKQKLFLIGLPFKTTLPSPKIHVPVKKIESIAARVRMARCEENRRGPWADRCAGLAFDLLFS
jgi:hypothetical protein